LPEGAKRFEKVQASAKAQFKVLEESVAECTGEE
jgi:hypothetical protein